MKQPVYDPYAEADPDQTLTCPYAADRGAPVAGPARVGRYEIRAVLGAGAMGVVYRAHDPDLGRSVAIKVVRDSGGTASSDLRLLREAQAMARLRHPNVVPIFDVGQADGAVFVAMPPLEGGTLKRWLREGPRSLDAILDAFIAAARGLAAAHAAGIVHRDFKPDNVLLGTDGEIQVADFGLARLADGEPVPDSSPSSLVAGEVTQTGVLLGTPAYMAPEQLRNLAIDARADQFSFCVALWEAVFGERPFPDPAANAARPLRARLAAIIAGPRQPRDKRPSWLSPLLARGLAPDPGRRWPTLQALLNAIAAHRGRRRWPRQVVLGMGAIGLAAAIVVSAWPARSALAPRFHLEPLIQHAGLRSATISPDASKVAIVAGDSLVIRSLDVDTDDRVLIAHGIGDTVADVPAAWSPDGRRLLVAATPSIAGVFDTELVDIRDGARSRLPTRGVASFLSDTEIVTWTFRERSIAIYRVDGHAAIATCDVPGDYAILWSVLGMLDGSMVAVVQKGESSALVILARDCRLRATFSAEQVSSVGVSDAGTVIALVRGDDFGDIVEISLDGAVLSRRRIKGSLDDVLGRRRGVDYVIQSRPRTDLVRVHGREPALRVFSVAGIAWFGLAADGETLAWIEPEGRSPAHGQLRLSRLQDLSRRGRSLLNNALMAGWSPDGQSLAVVVDESDGVPEVDQPRSLHAVSSSLSIIDRSGHESRRIALDHIDRNAAPVWLDNHRVAVQTDDRTTYRWFALNSDEQGKVVDSSYGSTYWLTRSPRDGTLAMWRNGPPGTIDARPEHVWLQTPDHPARVLHVHDALRHFLAPSWSPSGELFVRALETGLVSRVALDTGELTALAQLAETPMRQLFDTHLMTLADGDLLAVDVDLGLHIMAVAPDDDSRPVGDPAPQP